MAAKIFGVDVETLLHLLIIFITGKHAMDLTGMKKSGATIHQQFEGDSAGGGVKTSSFVSQAQKKLRNLLPTFTRESHAALALKITSQTSILGELTEDMVSNFVVAMQTLEKWELTQFIVTMWQIFKQDNAKQDGSNRVVAYIAYELSRSEHANIRTICRGIFLIDHQKPMPGQIIDSLETASRSIVQAIISAVDKTGCVLEEWGKGYQDGFVLREDGRKRKMQWFVSKLSVIATVVVVMVTIPLIAFVSALIKNGGIGVALVLLVAYITLLALLKRVLAPVKVG